jgi:hypothetical protein
MENKAFQPIFIP